MIGTVGPVALEVRLWSACGDLGYCEGQTMVLRLLFSLGTDIVQLPDAITDIALMVVVNFN